MDRMRMPFFIAALVLILVVVLMEVGSLALLRPPGDAASSLDQSISDNQDLSDAYGELDDADKARLLQQDKPPGKAIPYMALVDGILLFTVGLMGVGLILRERLQARIQGCATGLSSCLMILLAIGLIIVAFLSCLLMLGLLLAVPFGTLVYLAIYGFFNRTGASVTLGLLMALKVGFVVCLVLAHQRFLQNKGLVLMILTSFVSNVIVSFLQGIVPRFLVSITDAVAAIIVAIIAVIWGLVLLVGAVISVVKALRVDRV